jgi:hypothetical protein
MLATMMKECFCRLRKTYTFYIAILMDLIDSIESLLLFSNIRTRNCLLYVFKY